MDENFISFYWLIPFYVILFLASILNLMSISLYIKYFTNKLNNYYSSIFLFWIVFWSIFLTQAELEILVLLACGFGVFLIFMSCLQRFIIYIKFDLDYWVELFFGFLFIIGSIIIYFITVGIFMYIFLRPDVVLLRLLTPFLYLFCFCAAFIFIFLFKRIFYRETLIWKNFFKCIVPKIFFFNLLLSMHYLIYMLFPLKYVFLVITFELLISDFIFYFYNNSWIPLINNSSNFSLFLRLTSLAPWFVLFEFLGLEFFTWYLEFIRSKSLLCDVTTKPNLPSSIMMMMVNSNTTVQHFLRQPAIINAQQQNIVPGQALRIPFFDRLRVAEGAPNVENPPRLAFDLHGDFNARILDRPLFDVHENLTTEELTTEVLTTEVLTTEVLTTEVLTTEVLTTEVLTTEVLTTEVLTFQTSAVVNLLSSINNNDGGTPSGSSTSSEPPHSDGSQKDEHDYLKLIDHAYNNRATEYEELATKIGLNASTGLPNKYTTDLILPHVLTTIFRFDPTTADLGVCLTSRFTPSEQLVFAEEALSIQDVSRFMKSDPQSVLLFKHNTSQLYCMAYKGNFRTCNTELNEVTTSFMSSATRKSIPYSVHGLSHLRFSRINFGDALCFNTQTLAIVAFIEYKSVIRSPNRLMVILHDLGTTYRGVHGQALYVPDNTLYVKDDTTIKIVQTSVTELLDCPRGEEVLRQSITSLDQKMSDPVVEADFVQDAAMHRIKSEIGTNNYSKTKKLFDDVYVEKAVAPKLVPLDKKKYGEE